MEDGEDTALVIDNGSEMCRSGFSGNDAPQSVYPTIVQRTRSSIRKQDVSVLDACTSHWGKGYQSPIENSIIIDWDGMEELWHEIFCNDLRVSPDQYPILLSERPLNPKAAREKMASIMFETFNSPALYLANSAVLSSYATGRLTSVVTASGSGVSHTVPIYEGHALPHATNQFALAGDGLTTRMVKLLNERGYTFDNPFVEREIAREIKEKYGYVALDYKEEMTTNVTESDTKSTYKLPDGKMVSIDSDMFLCTEVFFQPSIIEMKCAGIHFSLHESIVKCDPDLHTELYWNIVLSGASTKFPRFADRLRKELAALTPTERKLRIVTPTKSEHKFTVWIGGSILASLSTFEDMLVSRSEYDENGGSIVHRKCF